MTSQPPEQGSPDQLAAIKEATRWGDLSFAQIDWLLAEVEEGRREVDRLRGLLRKLELVTDREDQDGSCPVCGERRIVANSDGSVYRNAHDPSCWLAAALRAT